MSVTTDARNETSAPDPASRWVDLCAELIEAFPGLRQQDVIAQVMNGRAATDLFGLDFDEQYEATATIARNNLDLLVNGNDLARLDPETHARRKRDE